METTMKQPVGRELTSAATNRIQNLSAGWKLACDSANQGKNFKWYINLQEKEARPAMIPGILQEVFPDYHGVAWYWTTFRTMLKKHPASVYALKFQEVDYFAEVWLNGVYLGSHEGAEFAFEMNVQKALKFDAENLLVVRVINPIEEPIDGFVLGDTAHGVKFNKNYMSGAMYNYGGITQRVELIETDPVRIGDVHAKADMKANAIKVSVTIRNDLETPVAGRLTATVRLRNSDLVLVRQELPITASSGQSDQAITIPINQPQYWSPEDPQFYLVTVDLECEQNAATCQDQKTVRCGFRELRVDNGYFRLNGKRIFIRCTLTVNDYCCGDKIPMEHLKRDLIFAKAAGFNTVRFLIGGVYPEQLDLCDEIGLMVYEESYASWYLSDPRLKSEYTDMSKMPERYDASMLGIIARDRNHPSVTIWGMLNETFDGPVFRHVYNSLEKVRALDDSRLVLLNSGRWDGIITVGSLSNPGSTKWEAQWGKETTDGLPKDEVDAQGKTHPTFVQGGLGETVQKVLGDCHYYPLVPYDQPNRDFFKTHGRDTKPIFQSECGTGSLLNVIDGLRQYQQAGAFVKLNNYMRLQKQVELLTADWKRFGMNDVYAFPEDMYIDSYAQQVRQARLEYDLVRSNPKMCGLSITTMVDVGVGDGRWTYAREMKPGMFDTMRDGWAPLRWCLFVEPGHVYAGREFTLEAVLATEDVLKPGTYAADLKIFGEPGMVWEKHVTFSVPQPPKGSDGPLAINVLRESIKLDVPPGAYEFTASLEQGGAPAGSRRKFYLSAPVAASKSDVTVLGLEKEVEHWLQSHGVTCRPFDAAHSDVTEVILVGDLSKTNSDFNQWKEILQKMARGSTVVFLSPCAFKRGDDAVGWLPLAKKGCGYWFGDWVYHKECVAKPHPVFDGLQPRGVMNWEYYDQVIPHFVFDGQDTPDDIAAVWFATGYNDGMLSEKFRTGYGAGLLFAGYKFGQGRFFINTFRILENLNLNPTADRMLLNIIRYAQKEAGKPLAALPDDFNVLVEHLYDKKVK
jgi:hypothetical protein